MTIRLNTPYPKDFIRRIESRLMNILEYYNRYSQISKAYTILNKETLKVEESINVTFDESLPKSRTSPLVDDDMIEEQAVQNYDSTQNPNCDLEEIIPRVENIREISDHPINQVIRELDERTLRSHAQERSNFFAFVSSIEPKNIKEAIKDESWTMAMQEELDQFVRIMEMEPDIENMTLNEYLDYEAKRKRRLWDNYYEDAFIDKYYVLPPLLPCFQPSLPHNERGYESPNTNNEVDIDSMTIVEYNLYIARQIKNPLCGKL
ncbi:hypothetical protein Tco_0893085 [Tanacetum coccineum]|uniref:Gag-Pol polyprotein n=1 Tax=Tanacetum coccineum TaxID=301880 RepID=A0ABQ5CAQ4_9ASTR